MQLVNVHKFYDLGASVHALDSLPETVTLGNCFLPILLANFRLKQLLENQLLPINVCRVSAEKLVSALKDSLPDDLGPNTDWNLETTKDKVQAIKTTLKEFETVFSAELPSLATYFVDQKGIYSTKDLIERAENMFSETVRVAMNPQTVEDIRQAGRSIAFDLPTASGFHSLRAIESILRLYYSNILKKSPTKRDWGTYIEDLKKGGADQDILSAIDQIRSLHRNPLIHPEDNLTVDQAVALLALAQGAILGMITDIEKRKSTTAVAAASLTAGAS
jgi:hypothetical protein